MENPIDYKTNVKILNEETLNEELLKLKKQHPDADIVTVKHIKKEIKKEVSVLYHTSLDVGSVIIAFETFYFRLVKIKWGEDKVCFKYEWYKTHIDETK